MCSADHLQATKCLFIVEAERMIVILKYMLIDNQYFINMKYGWFLLPIDVYIIFRTLFRVSLILTLIK